MGKLTLDGFLGVDMVRVEWKVRTEGQQSEVESDNPTVCYMAHTNSVCGSRAARGVRSGKRGVRGVQLDLLGML